MATNEFQARALFDFLAEGPSELSLTTGEIITITSGTNGNDWWYGQNSSGQCGAVPATYVEILNGGSNSIQKSSDVDTINDNSIKIQTSSETNHQSGFEGERKPFMTSTPIYNSELGSSTFDPSNQSTEHDFTDSSFDSLSSPASNDNQIDSTSITASEFDPYRTIIDPSLPTSTIKSSVTISEEQNSLLGDIMLSPSGSKSDYAYDTPSSLIVPVTSNETIPVRSVSINQSPSSNDLVNNNSTTNTTKSKPEKTKLFSLIRQKPKPESDKRRMSTDSFVELPSTIPSKDESDSDGPNDSSSTHYTLSNSHRSSLAGGDSRTLARAKLFDKHGVGNYLLHECKNKSDEHVEIGYDENKGGVYWSPNPSIPPFSCKIENSSKETKFSGFKSFVEYKIHPQIPGSRVVGRRYKQFDWLHEQLVIKYRFICIPPLPEKQIAGRFEQEFIEERRRQLELWLNRICRHPVLCASFPVQHFTTCELTEKNNKDWKGGKRKTEKDEFRESSWLHCVTFADSNLSDTEITSKIDAFAQQQPALETHLKNINLGFTKYLERHTEIYENDMQRVGELFTKLHVVVQVDSNTPGNNELSDIMSKISSTYNGIAELYKTKGYEGIREFTERMYEYIGLLACFPIIINIQRSAMEFIRNAQLRGASVTSDINGAIHRSKILNHVVLAEINFFQKDKVNDLKLYMKSLLDQQIEFYQKITSELHDAVSTFN